MFAKDSFLVGAIGLLCLTLVGGCKTFSGRTLDESGMSVRETPSQNRQPVSLTELTGAPGAMQPTPPPADPAQGLGEDNQDLPAGIGLDEVALDTSQVHVDAGVDIEDIEKDAQEQLPKIVESAVHPFSEISQPLTISDQTPGQLTATEPAEHPIQTVPPQSTPPTPGDNNPAASSESGVTAAPLPQNPQDSSPPPIVTRQQAEATAPPAAGDSTQVVRIIADAGGEPETERSGSATDLLFADDTSEAPALQGDVSIVVAGSQRASTPSTAIQQTTHLQPVAAATTPENTQPPEMPLSPGGPHSESLAAAIQMRQHALVNAGQQASLNDQVAMQLLRIVDGQASVDSLQVTSGDEKLRHYWNQQLKTIALIMQESEGDTSTAAAAARRRRITEATSRLEQAHDHLASLATLRLPQCVFASEVRGFGQFTKLPAAFLSGQQVLIYCEIENYSLRETDVSGEIQQVAELQGQYSIVDANNRVVFQHQYQPVKDMSQRRRQDFYMFFPLTIPNLPVGNYRLQMSVEDLVGNKVASHREDMIFNVVDNRRAIPAAQVASNPNQRFVSPPRSAGAQPSPTSRIPSASNNGNQPLPMSPANTPLSDKDLPPVVRR